MIPLVSPILGKEEKRIVNEIIDSRIIASGKYVQQLEATAAKINGVKHAIAVSNGTTALHTALLACGIGAGDKVLTTPFTFIATSNSILHCNAVPVFADIDPLTYNLSPESAEAALKKHKGIKAIIVVHLYGMPADMDAFMRLKKKYKLVIIEDCAQAHGALYKGKMVGSFGDAAAFSYYATKNVTMGEGGVILTNSPKTDALARQIINHGRAGHSTHTVLGYNFRLTNIAAGIGLVQLSHLYGWNKKRLANARYLNSKLEELPFVVTPHVPENCVPVFHQYTVRVDAKERDAFMKHLTANGIGNGIYYPIPSYQQPLYKKLGYGKVVCPDAEAAACQVVSLPVHPGLTKKELDSIVAAVASYRQVS